MNACYDAGREELTGIKGFRGLPECLVTACPKTRANPKFEVSMMFILSNQANTNTIVTMADEINLTLFHPPSSKTDAISLPPSTTLSDLSSFASAILGLDDSSIVISKDSFASLPLLFSPMNAATDGSKALAQCGIVNGDLLSVMTKVR